jgi:sulfite exporter TauE/SafE
MCGGFPLHLAKADARGSLPLRQTLFVAGKSMTYIFLGALAAALGVILLKSTPIARAAPALRIAAGAITFVFGMAMLGVPWRRLVSAFPPRKAPVKSGTARSGGDEGKGEHGRTEERKHGRQGSEGAVGRLFGGMLGGLLNRPSPSSAFVLGLAVGFLPCPLPLGMLAIAAASHNVPTGIALMAGVGLGTAPGLLAVGLFGSGLNWKLKKTGMRTAGVIVSVIGLLTVCRAIGGIPRSHVVDSVVPSCCQEQRAK